MHIRITIWGLHHQLSGTSTCIEDTEGSMQRAGEDGVKLFYFSTNCKC